MRPQITASVRDTGKISARWFVLFPLTPWDLFCFKKKYICKWEEYSVTISTYRVVRTPALFMPFYQFGVISHFVLYQSYTVRSKRGFESERNVGSCSAIITRTFFFSADKLMQLVFILCSPLQAPMCKRFACAPRVIAVLHVQVSASLTLTAEQTFFKDELATP